MSEIHLDVLADLDKKRIRRVSRQLREELSDAGTASGKAFGRRLNAQVDAATRQTVDRIASSNREIERSMNRVHGLRTRELSQLDRLESATRDQISATRDLDRAQRARHDDELRRLRKEADLRESLSQRATERELLHRRTVERHRRRDRDRDLLGTAVTGLRGADAVAGLGSKATTTAAQLGAASGSLSSSLGQFALAGHGAGMAAMLGAAVSLGPALIAVASAATTATQSVLLLPAAATAAGAAFGSLRLGLAGFFDTIGDIRDPEAFAAGLHGLSSEAQQAALSIQALLPQFDALKLKAQDALFSGVGPRLEQLTNTFLPTVENMVTRINTSFNGMFDGLADRLMTPEMQGSISSLADNIGTAFEQLQPAVADVAEAFVTMASAGSSFLPDIARAASDAARSFRDFVDESVKSGDFADSLGKGLDALHMLGTLAFDAGEMLYNLFGDMSREDIRSWKLALEGVIGVFEAFKPVISGCTSLIETLITGSTRAVNALIRTANAAIRVRNAVLPGDDIATIPTLGVPDFSFQPPSFPPVGVGSAGGSVALGGLGPAPANRPLPPNPGTGGGRGGSSKSPGPVVPFTGDPMQFLPPGEQVTAATYGAAQSLLDAQHRVAQERAELNAIEADNNSTAEDIQRARNELAQAEQDRQKAELRLAEARQSATKTQTQHLQTTANAMESIGAQLDRDLGISKGLPGLADNLVRFLASLAFAPAMGALAAQRQIGMQQAGLSQSGSGLFGMMMAPSGGDGAALPTSYSSTMGVPAARSGNVAQMLAFAQNLSGKVKYGPASDMANGLADCSGSISDLVEILQTGQSTGKRLFTTTNFASDASAAKLGFLPGYKPGAFNVGVTPLPGMSGHMAATLPNGVNFEGGGGTGGGAQYGGSATGALDPQFSKRYHLPVGGGTGLPGGGYTPALGTPGGTITPGMTGGGYAPLTPEQLTNPGLTNPMPMGGGTVPGMGAGMPQAMPQQQGPVGYQPGGGWQPSGGGFSGLGGAPMGAIQGAVSAAGSAAAPFGGQAAAAGAQMLMQIINRTAAYGGQAAAIGVQGLMQTLIPSGSQLGDLSQNWIGKVASGFAGARPAQAVSAGKQEAPDVLTKGSSADPNTTQQHGQGGSPGQGNGPLIGELHTNDPKDGQKIAREVQWLNAYGAGGER